MYGHVSFQDALVWREVDNVVLGLLLFVISVKLLRLIRFNKHVAVFSITLRNSARHLASFNVIFLILFHCLLALWYSHFRSGI